MALVTKVKAGKITNLTDARYCAGMGVEWIGFPAATVSAKTFSEITGWLAGPQWVIELGSAPWPNLQAYGSPVWQCSFDNLAEALSLAGQLIVELPAKDLQAANPHLLSNSNRIEALLLTHVSAGFSFATLQSDFNSFPVLIDLDTCAFELRDLLAWPNGLQVSGGTEERPGLRDVAALAEVLEQLEVE
ncbi:MAG: hypothetical protein J0L66_03090 [Cytophagales bacterium]|nr:hypothetical protein [Cytophagales bacterium]